MEFHDSMVPCGSMHEKLRPRDGLRIKDNTGSTRFGTRMCMKRNNTEGQFTQDRPKKKKKGTCQEVVKRMNKDQTGETRF